jgi:predicted DCC family thiol-disulfide oxidoreductase YuxK
MAETDAEDGADDPLADIDLDAGPILLFDGVCNLCSGVVRFLAPRDPTGRIRFASLQSPVGRALLERGDRPTDEFDSIVLVEGEDHYVKSTAALRVAHHLRAPWSWLAALRVVPRPLRDAVYALVARSRYRIFGRKDHCVMPAADLRERFIENGIESTAGQTA